MAEGEVTIWVDHNRPNHWDEALGKYVAEAKGGTTTVKLLNEAGDVLAEAEAVCSPLDNYNRKLGVTIALGRAQKKLRQASV